jgi:hypothetical protein
MNFRNSFCSKHDWTHRVFTISSIEIRIYKKWHNFLYTFLATYSNFLPEINLLKTKLILLYIYGISSYRAKNTFHHSYKSQSVNEI